MLANTSRSLKVLLVETSENDESTNVRKDDKQWSESDSKIVPF